MKNKKLLALVAGVSPALMAASLIPSRYSYPWGITIHDMVDEVVSTGIASQDMKNSADGIMCTITLKYEVLKMAHNQMYVNNQTLLQINYRVEIELFTHVPYKNGFMYLFTEYGETRYKNATINCKFASSTGSLLVIGNYPNYDCVSPADGNQLDQHLFLPEDNPNLYSGQLAVGSTDNASGRYYYLPRFYWDNGDVATMTSNHYRPENDQRVSLHTNYDSFNQKVEYDATYTSVTEPNNAETVIMLGGFTYLMNDIATMAELSVEVYANISEGNFWGQCDGYKTVSALVPLNA